MVQVPTLETASFFWYDTGSYHHSHLCWCQASWPPTVGILTTSEGWVHQGLSATSRIARRQKNCGFGNGLLSLVMNVLC